MGVPKPKNVILGEDWREKIEEKTSLENLCKILVRRKTGVRLKDLLSTLVMGDNLWVLGFVWLGGL